MPTGESPTEIDPTGLSVFSSITHTESKSVVTTYAVCSAGSTATWDSPEPSSSVRTTASVSTSSTVTVRSSLTTQA